MASAVVVFDPAEFREAYPKFTTDLLSDGELQNAFEVACVVVDNTPKSKIPYDPDNGVEIRKTLLYLLICHLATLALWPVGQSGPQSNATQGSVSVGFAIPTWLNGQYFNQTPCGQTFWLLIQRYLIGGRYYAAKVFHPWG